MKNYKRTTKPRFKNRGEIVLRISELAEEIRGGEENRLEEYNKVVKEYADITRQQAPAEDDGSLRAGLLTDGQITLTLWDKVEGYILDICFDHPGTPMSKGQHLRRGKCQIK